MPKKSKPKFYAVMRGHETGIFTTWEACKAQVHGYADAVYKSFPTREEAQAALDAYAKKPWRYCSQSSQPKPSLQAPPEAIIADSICVDAACSGNPGDVEYQGVHTTTKEQLFHAGPLPYGTNNLGEFLAIVHGLSYLKQHNSNRPIYTDSKTAMAWVRNRKVKTTLIRDDRNDEIFARVDRALAWLEVNTYTNPILKWDTDHWGEIPADFGRK